MITTALGTEFYSVLSALKGIQYADQVFPRTADQWRANIDAIIASADIALSAVKTYAPDRLRVAEVEIAGVLAVAAREMEAV